MEKECWQSPRGWTHTNVWSEFHPYLSSCYFRLLWAFPGSSTPLFHTWQKFKMPHSRQAHMWKYVLHISSPENMKTLKRLFLMALLEEGLRKSHVCRSLLNQLHSCIEISELFNCCWKLPMSRKDQPAPTVCTGQCQVGRTWSLTVSSAFYAQCHITWRHWLVSGDTCYCLNWGEDSVKNTGG